MEAGNPAVPASVERLLQLVVHNAWVETHVQEYLVARTAVGWTGDLQTVWYEQVSAAHAAFHQRALALALASRETLLRTVALAARGALTLSILLGKRAARCWPSPSPGASSTRC